MPLAGTLLRCRTAGLSAHNVQLVGQACLPDIGGGVRVKRVRQVCPTFYEAGPVKSLFRPSRIDTFNLLSELKRQLSLPAAGPLNSAMTPILPKRAQQRPRSWLGLSSCVSINDVVGPFATIYATSCLRAGLQIVSSRSIAQAKMASFLATPTIAIFRRELLPRHNRIYTPRR